MKVLNLYYSATGNTDRVAEQIEETVREAGHEVETIKAAKDIELDILAYDFAFIGSGVYYWLPGKPLMEPVGRLGKNTPMQGRSNRHPPGGRAKKLSYTAPTAEDIPESMRLCCGEVHGPAFRSPWV